MDKKTRLFLICGSLGSLLSIFIFFAEGCLRSDYTALKFPISSLAIGPRGWVQVSNFLIGGSALLISSLGTKRLSQSTQIPKRISLLIALTGLGLIGAGIFVTDPVYGYPVTEPLRLSQFTTSGHLHDLCSIVVFICLPVICFKYTKWFKQNQKNGLSIYCLLSGIITLTTFFMAGAGFKQTAFLVNIAGVLQRLSIISATICLIIILRFHLKHSVKQGF